MPDEVVLDASAYLKTIVEDTQAARDLEHRLNTSGLHAPHLIDAEVGSVVRRKLLGGFLDEQAAVTALMALDGVIDVRYPHAGPLARDAWDLRDRVPFYDALYVALAARLELPLLTADGRLARTHDLPGAIEVV